MRVRKHFEAPRSLKFFRAGHWGTALPGSFARLARETLSAFVQDVFSRCLYVNSPGGQRWNLPPDQRTGVLAVECNRESVPSQGRHHAAYCVGCTLSSQSSRPVLCIAAHQDVVLMSPYRNWGLGD